MMLDLNIVLINRAKIYDLPKKKKVLREILSLGNRRQIYKKLPIRLDHSRRIEQLILLLN